MKFVFAIIISFSITIVCSCETPSGDVVPIEDLEGVVYHAEVTTIFMPDTIDASDTLFVTLGVTTSHGIHRLSHVVLNRDPNRITAQVFGIITNPFPRVMGGYSADIEVYPVDPGVFTLAVIQPNRGLWEETVFVAVQKP